MSDKKHVTILISGRGSNMEALIKACKEPNYPAKIVGVISDKKEASGLQIAKEYGIPIYAIERKDFLSKHNFEQEILKTLKTLKTDIICLAGYMRILSADFIMHYEDKILNIHPSLLPAFKGLNVHEKMLQTGVKIAGCTVHIVTAEMDDGPILAQGALIVRKQDTAISLAQRILDIEHKIYPIALENFINNGKNTLDEEKFLLSF